MATVIPGKHYKLKNKETIVVFEEDDSNLETCYHCGKTIKAGKSHFTLMPGSFNGFYIFDKFCSASHARIAMNKANNL